MRFWLILEPALLPLPSPWKVGGDVGSKGQDVDKTENPGAARLPAMFLGQLKALGTIPKDSRNLDLAKLLGAQVQVTVCSPGMKP